MLELDAQADILQGAVLLFGGERFASMQEGPQQLSSLAEVDWGSSSML